MVKCYCGAVRQEEPLGECVGWQCSWGPCGYLGPLPPCMSPCFYLIYHYCRRLWLFQSLLFTFVFLHAPVTWTKGFHACAGSWLGLKEAALTRTFCCCEWHKRCFTSLLNVVAVLVLLQLWCKWLKTFLLRLHRAEWWLSLALKSCFLWHAVTILKEYR